MSSLLLSAFFAAPFGAPLSDNIGRKPMIIYSLLVTCIGALIQASSVNLATMLLGRCVTGVGIGLLSCIIPVYLAEITPKSIRGKVLSLWRIFYIYMDKCTEIYAYMY